jgi:phosphoglucosamine mutase
MGFDCGISITASHNLYQDNGIKIFNRDGRKLSQEQTALINSKIGSKRLGHSDGNFAKDKVCSDSKLTAETYYQVYKNALLRGFCRGFSLDGVSVAIDCANGANSEIAPRLFEELGAKVAITGCKPNGKNINSKVGATCPESIINLTLSTKSDVGIAFDGDGDRLIMCDEVGKAIDGDAIVATLAIDMLKKGILKRNSVVVTSMSNMGLEVFLSQNGIAVHRSDVGDSSVAKMMLDKGAVLGGEQSGHIIIGDKTSTGDGILSALHMLSVIIDNKIMASKAFHLFAPYPQFLKNFSTEPSVLNDQHAKSELAKIMNKAASVGCRVLVRPSGTEPLIRVMVEGQNAVLLQDTMAALSDWLTNI